MPSKKDLTDAYQAAILDEANNSTFIMFKDPNEIGKTVKGRLTQHKGNFYIKTPTRFYLTENSPKVQKMHAEDQNVEVNHNPPQTVVNGVPIQAEVIL